MMGAPKLLRDGYLLIVHAVFQASWMVVMGLPWLLELYRQPWSHEETNKLSVLNQIMQYTRLVRLKTDVHFDPNCDSLEPRVG